MSVFSQFYDIRNLRRAYRWILSYPDPRYKNFFRRAYSAYALSSDHNLKYLQRQIRDGLFEPSHASKIYVPKSSGLVRTLSLLTVNDQIAYQACANIVAEALAPRVTKRMNRSVFYHQYAGKSSAFFYRRWQNSYQAYSNSIRSNFRRGFEYVATFDLTAFYDSIDHHVLKTFLGRSRVDPQTTEFLLRCLKHWTSSTWSGGRGTTIYHEHGIPQGPQPSGMISEVVLQHLDNAGDRTPGSLKYLRYVDDIRIMARDETSLRRRLVSLDIASKEIGLFPQGAKIDIRKISDPEDEIKSVSLPPEAALTEPIDQAAVRARIRELGSRGKPRDSTRFRYVLAELAPSHHTNTLLSKVLENKPELSSSVTRHFSRYRTLPRILAQRLVATVTAEGVYHSVNAELLDLLYGRISPPNTANVADFAYERLFAPRYRRPPFAAPQPSYRSALIRWALLSARMTFADAQSLLNVELDWWVRQELLGHLDSVRWGQPSYEALLNRGARVSSPEPARVAASLIFESDAAVLAPQAELYWSAKLLLRTVGLIRRTGPPPSVIPQSLAYTTGYTAQYDWGRFFQAQHREAQKLAMVCKQRYETDIDAFIVSLDSFCDLVLRQLYLHNGSVMIAKYGSALGAGSPAWLRTNFPVLRAGFYALHQMRIRSFTAHPRHTTGAPNRRLTHRHYYRLRRDILAAFNELARVLPL